MICLSMVCIGRENEMIALGRLQCLDLGRRQQGAGRCCGKTATGQTPCPNRQHGHCDERADLYHRGCRPDVAEDRAVRRAHRIIVMDRAVIAQEGAPRALYEEPANAFVAGFVDSIAGGGSLITIPARGFWKCRITRPDRSSHSITRQ